MFGFGTTGAEASTFSDIPNALNDALFDGQNILGAQLILSSGMLVSAALGMGLVRVPVIPMIAIIITIMGALVAINWLPYWVMLLAAVFIAGTFASKIAGIPTGEDK